MNLTIIILATVAGVFIGVAICLSVITSCLNARINLLDEQQQELNAEAAKIDDYIETIHRLKRSVTTFVNLSDFFRDEYSKKSKELYTCQRALAVAIAERAVYRDAWNSAKRKIDEDAQETKESE